MQRYHRLMNRFAIRASIQSFNAFLGVDCLRCDNADFDDIIGHVTNSDVLRFRAYLENDGETDTFDMVNIAA